MTLSDPLIKSVLEKIDSPAVIGVGIVGSYSRGQETKYSDVDFNIFVNQMPENEYDRYILQHWDNKLISLKYVLLDDELAALNNPRRAIWAVPGLSGMQIILDKDGSLAELQKPSGVLPVDGQVSAAGGCFFAVRFHGRFLVFHSSC